MATLVPVSLGGTGSNNITGAIDNLGISDSTVITNLDNVNMSTVTIEGLTLNDATGVPTFINSNLYMTQGTRINGSPVLDSPILNNASISTGGLTWLTENGNAFVTTARLVFGTAYESNVKFPSPITYNGYFAVDHAHSRAFFSDGYKYNEILTSNASIIPNPNFGAYAFSEDEDRTILFSSMDIGSRDAKVRNINMHGALRGANIISVNESFICGGDSGFRFRSNDEFGDQTIVGPGDLEPGFQFQINGNLRINGNVTIIGATISQDIAAQKVQTNLHHYASTTNTTINSLIFGVDSANTNIDTVQGNLHSFGSYANSRFTSVHSDISSNVDIVQSNLHALGSHTNTRINIVQSNLHALGSYANTRFSSVHSDISSNVDIVQSNLHALGSYANTRFSSVHSDISSNVNIVQSNLHALGSYANTTFSGNHSDLTANINLVQDNVTSIHSGSQEFTVEKIFNDDVIIQGSLTVQGETITADVSTIVIEDPFIVLANNQPSPAAYDAGLLVYRPSVVNQAWIWDEANDGWAALSTNDDGSSSGSITGIAYQDIYGRDVKPQRYLQTPDAYITNLAADRVVYTAGSGLLQVDNGFTFDGDTVGISKVDIASGYIDQTTLGATIEVEVTANNLTVSTGVDITDSGSDGTMDGVIIGSSDPVAGTFTTLTSTSLNVSDGNITNVGDINLDSISSDNGTDFDILLDDNQTTALEIKQGANPYVTFVTTDGSEEVTFDEKLQMSTGVTFASDTVDIDGGTIDGVAIGTTTPLSELAVDNLNLNGNQISSTDTDGNIVLEPNGTGKVDVGSQLTADSLNVEDLTSGRVVYVGTSGELQDDADFTFNGTTVTINTVDINGGAIDGTNIGAASQGTGNFTSLETDSLSVTNATASTSKDTGAIIITQGGLGVEGAIHAGGDVEAFNTSDSRLKENVVPITSALSKIDSINGVEFDWNASEAGLNYSHLGGHDVGVIAQDLQEILPEAVKERDDGYLAVDYGRVVPLLIQAIKELKAKIEEK